MKNIPLDTFITINLGEAVKNLAEVNRCFC